MKSILVVFMVHYLNFSESDSIAINHFFNFLCYILPLFGAYLSDRFLGKYKTIIYLSLVYCLGHLVLAIWENKTGLYYGLLLIALGSGGIKPCVSAHVGDQFTKKNQHLLRKVFNLFYWMINFGSFFSTLITPWVLPRYGPSIAFGIPGALMFVATFIFWMGRKYYVHIPPTGKNPNSVSSIIFSGIKGKLRGRSFWNSANDRHPIKKVNELKSLYDLMLIFLAVSIFWSIFDQFGSSWIVQGEKMNKTIFGISVEAAQMQALNPVLIMILIPVFSKWIYPFFEKNIKNFNALSKMRAGMFIAFLSFLSATIIQAQIDNGSYLGLIWQGIPFFLITISEVLISITGLEFAYTQAPKSMKSTIMSFWLLTVAIGNLLTAVFTKTGIFKNIDASYFAFFTFLMLLMAICFLWISKNYKIKNYVES